MKRNGYQLFPEGRIAHLTVKNRLVRSATFEGSMTEDGKVTPEMLNIYRNLAVRWSRDNHHRSYGSRA